MLMLDDLQGLCFRWTLVCALKVSDEHGTSSGLDDGLIHLNEFFRVARAVIPVDVASLELVWPPDFSEWSRQNT
jgi:hypothetical protein